MNTRLLVVVALAGSLMSYGALAASNHSTTTQHGFGNVGLTGQIAIGAKSTNTSTITQRGAFNGAETVQGAAFGGTNTSSVTQGGVNNVAVTGQVAF
jgi:hypothetical protein